MPSDCTRAGLQNAPGANAQVQESKQFVSGIKPPRTDSGLVGFDQFTQQGQQLLLLLTIEHFKDVGLHLRN